MLDYLDPARFKYYGPKEIIDEETEPYGSDPEIRKLLIEMGFVGRRRKDKWKNQKTASSAQHAKALFLKQKEQSMSDHQQSS